MRRYQYFGRGCTCVTLGLAMSVYLAFIGRENVVALVVAIVTLYPGFTMIGMAIWQE